MKALPLLALLFSAYALASQIEILQTQRNGDVLSVMTKTAYQMSERESIEEVRRHVLDEQKQYALEYAGNYIRTENQLESIGDASISRSKRFIATYAASMTSSKIINESTTSSMQYLQTLEVAIDTQALQKEIQREIKLTKVMQGYDRSIQIKGEGFATQKENAQKDEQFNRERSDTLAKFGRTLINNQFLKCTVSSLEGGTQRTKATYACIYEPPKEILENYRLYYQTDICDVKMVERSRDGGTNILGSIAGGLGKVLAYPFTALIHSMEAKVENSASSDVEFKEVDLEFSNGAGCTSKSVKKEQNLMAVISLYGFKSKITIPVVQERNLLAKAIFTLNFYSNKDVKSIKDISGSLGIYEKLFVPIQFKENYSLYETKTDQKRNQ